MDELIFLQTAARFSSDIPLSERQVPVWQQNGDLLHSAQIVTNDLYMLYPNN